MSSDRNRQHHMLNGTQGTGISVPLVGIELLIQHLHTKQYEACTEDGNQEGQRITGRKIIKQL